MGEDCIGSRDVVCMRRIPRGGAVYTSGVWIVKEGREDEFERRWQESVDSLSLDFPGVKFMLLRDRDNPRRFVSLVEGWRNPEQIESARAMPSYQDSMAAVWRVLESGEIATLDLVAEVS
jgi:quinol monooxygenase YgiN